MAGNNRGIVNNQGDVKIATYHRQRLDNGPQYQQRRTHLIHPQCQQEHHLDLRDFRVLHYQRWPMFPSHICHPSVFLHAKVALEYAFGLQHTANQMASNAKGYVDSVHEDHRSSVYELFHCFIPCNFHSNRDITVGLASTLS